VATVVRVTLVAQAQRAATVRHRPRQHIQPVAVLLPASHPAAVMAAAQRTVTRIQSVLTAYHRAASTVEPVVLPAGLVEVLAGQVQQTVAVDSEAQARHPVAAEAVVRRSVTSTTVAVVVQVRLVGSCSRIRLLQQATGDGEYS